MRVHTNVILSLSRSCERFGARPCFVSVLFGSQHEAIECLELNSDRSKTHAQIHDYLDLMQQVYEEIAYVGLAFVGYDSNLTGIKSYYEGLDTNNHCVLLLDLDNQESPSCRAFELQNGDLAPTDFTLFSDEATDTAVTDALHMSGASDINRAKYLLREKIRELRRQLNTSTDQEEIASIILKYGQLKKMGELGVTDSEAPSDINVIYELIARVIKKSDEKYERSAASNMSNSIESRHGDAWQSSRETTSHYG